MDSLLRRRPTAVLDDLRASPLLFLARRVYAWTQSPPPVPHDQPSPTDIRVVCIADTHNTHSAQPPLPEGDILLHAGDLTQSGTLPELCDALAWLSVQPHPIKIFIGGNHDGALAEPETRAYIRQAYPALTYLENDVVQVTVRHHTLRIYGSPYTPQYGIWAFQYPRFPPSHPHLSNAVHTVDHHPAVVLWSAVPPQTDVLVTHGPPLGHLDHSAGCAALLSTLWRVRPRLHVFGHIHAARGVERVRWDDVQPAFEAVCAYADIHADVGMRARWAQFVTLVWRAVTAKLSAWWWGRRARQVWGRETVLVNAASVGDDHGLGGEEGGQRRGAIVVDVDLAS
ncbi:metallophosphoesterase domain-containing protein 1 [Boletus edulis]|nr:metallophosphoesterase domain-containing protein 1 [Boletus edulis]